MTAARVSLALCALLVSPLLLAETMGLSVSVDESGGRHFRLEVIGFELGSDRAQIEMDVRAVLPGVLAERQWCLNGWTILKTETYEIDSVYDFLGVAITGSCK